MTTPHIETTTVKITTMFTAKDTSRKWEPTPPHGTPMTTTKPKAGWTTTNTPGSTWVSTPAQTTTKGMGGHWDDEVDKTTTVHNNGWDGGSHEGGSNGGGSGGGGSGGGGSGGGGSGGGGSGGNGSGGGNGWDKPTPAWTPEPTPVTATLIMNTPPKTSFGIPATASRWHCVH